MNEFVWYNPTKILFGQGAVEKMRPELERYGRNILLTYGGGSIKRNGLYDKVKEILEALGKCVFELDGIMPNPRKEVVYRGIEICKKEKIKFLTIAQKRGKIAATIHKKEPHRRRLGR